MLDKVMDVEGLGLTEGPADRSRTHDSQARPATSDPPTYYPGVALTRFCGSPYNPDEITRD
jgi:hypothetical protein